MEKHRLLAFNIYFIFLFMLVISGIKLHFDIINIVYLIVVLCCSLKFFLIVNVNKR